MKLAKLVDYLDRLLRVEKIQDSSKNGLQVDGPAEVRRVAFAVDASEAAFKKAAKAGAQLLIVHHGLFWDKPLVLTGPHYRRVKTLIDVGIGLYASHLPLDAHPKLGHNAEICRALGLRNRRLFAKHHGQAIGIGGELPRPTLVAVLVKRLERLTGAPVKLVQTHGPKLARKVGCISGGAAFLLDQVQKVGFDTFVTGEASHSCFHDAAERGLNVIYGGHYATETPGLRALAKHLGRRFRLKTVFLDVPTEL